MPKVNVIQQLAKHHVGTRILVIFLHFSYGRQKRGRPVFKTRSCVRDPLVNGECGLCNLMLTPDICNGRPAKVLRAARFFQPTVRSSVFAVSISCAFLSKQYYLRNVVRNMGIGHIGATVSNARPGYIKSFVTREFDFGYMRPLITIEKGSSLYAQELGLRLVDFIISMWLVVRSRYLCWNV